MNNIIQTFTFCSVRFGCTQPVSAENVIAITFSAEIYINNTTCTVDKCEADVFKTAQKLEITKTMEVFCFSDLIIFYLKKTTVKMVLQLNMLTLEYRHKVKFLFGKIRIY
jgi:hypothetical protein